MKNCLLGGLGAAKKTGAYFAAHNAAGIANEQITVGKNSRAVTLSASESVGAVSSVGIANTVLIPEMNDSTRSSIRTKISTKTIIGAGSGATKLFHPGSRFAAA